MSFTRVIRRVRRQAHTAVAPRPSAISANKPVRPILHLKPAS